jgi:hypothetical protein
LWGIWRKYEKKKRDAPEHGGRDDAEQEYAEYTESDGKIRLPARVYPGAVSLKDSAERGRQVDEMFSQFKRANRLRSKKDMERIDRL